MLRRTALKRSPLRRKPPRRLRGPKADAAYLERVRGLPCCARHLGPCNGPIHAHHALGVSAKANDSTAIPLCGLEHHRAWHDHNGDFRGWSREKRRTFELLCIGLTKAMLANG